MTILNSNVKFCYLYRDGGNYKQYNEIVFLNDTSKEIEEIERLIKNSLLDGEWFNATDWKLPDLHFTEYNWDSEIDHPLHEFVSIIETHELPTSLHLLSTFLMNIIHGFA